MLETVTGTNGIIVPPDGYLQSIRETCDRYGILLIADEVMAGWGRTGRWFGVDNWDVVPDIITTAKGINSGYVPLGAMTVRDHVYDAIKDRFFAGGLTYSGHPLACASGVASIEDLPRGGHRRERRRAGRRTSRDELPTLAERHPSIGEVRGLGPLLGPRARPEPRDAGAARPVQRRRRGGRADDPDLRRPASSAGCTRSCTGTSSRSRRR